MQIKKKEKKKKLCLDHIWMWYNANHMLINPVKTKSMLINTRQKHQLSDLSLRLSLDGQNIQNATEDHPLGLIADNKFWWRAQIWHIIMQIHVKKKKKKKVFLHCKIIVININTWKIFYNAHIKPHTDYMSAVWDGCSEEHFKNHLTLYIKGQAN